MKRYSETKLEQLVPVQLEDGITLYIRNKKLITYSANTEEGYYILDDNTGAKCDTVTLYKQIFDSNGEQLAEPIYDKDNYYVCNDETGDKIRLYQEGLYD